MKSLSSFFSLAIFSAAIVSSIPITRRDVNEALVPQFGFSAGVNPTGTGDCDGAVKGTNGQPVKIPCSCPPDRATFIQSLNANVAAGHVLNNPSVPISFPEDNSTASQLARINAATVTLQNLNGSGKGCPVASTTFQAQAAGLATSQAREIGPRQAQEAAPAASQAQQAAPAASQAQAAATNINVPKVNEFILMERQLSSSSSPSPIPTINFTGPQPAILKARLLLPPTVGVVGSVGGSESSTPTATVVIDTLEGSASSSTPTATVVIDTLGGSAPSSTPTPTVSIPPVVGGILNARDTESASSSAPTPTVSLRFPIVEKILARQSESASSSAPTPTFSFPPTVSSLFPPVVEKILARQSTPSPSSSAKPEIILAGPPVIEA